MHQTVKPVNSCLSRNEAPTPTHFFLILTSCQNSAFSPLKCEGPLQARSFILPHRPDFTEVCKVSGTSHSFHRFANVTLPLWKHADSCSWGNFNSSVTDAFSHSSFLFRMSQTCRGWKSGYSFTPLGFETSSS